jgi:uncharacterized damage-inducible protein DinB
MMQNVDYFATMARYNHWMNDRLYAICAEFTDAERKTDRGSYFKSIHGTLNHILVGDHIWLGRLTGKTAQVSRLDQELHANFAELLTERRQIDGDIDAWVADLSDARLTETLTFRRVIDGQERTLPVWLAAMQLFNHQTHHRGQLTTLIMQAGKDPGLTDLPYTPNPYPA